MPHGGKRAGAGRKPKPAQTHRKALSCRVAPFTLARIASVKQSTGQSAGQIIDTAIQLLNLSLNPLKD